MSHEIQDETISGSLLFLHRDEFDAVLECSGVHGVSLRLAMKKIRGKKGLFPSISTMAKEAGIGTTKVKDILGKWVERGLLTIDERSGRSNVYTLLKVPDTQTPDDHHPDAGRLPPGREATTTQTPGVHDSPSEVLPQEVEPQEVEPVADDLETKRKEAEEDKQLNRDFRDMAKEVLEKGYTAEAPYQLIGKFWKDLNLDEKRRAVAGYRRYIAWWEAWIVAGRPQRAFKAPQWFLANRNWRDDLRFPGKPIPPSATQQIMAKKNPAPEERAEIDALLAGGSK